MKLFCRQLGSGYPLLILHGLYGSGDNWYSVGKALSHYFEIFLIDLRNHGYSPHHHEMNYEVMIDDLEELFIEKKLDKAHIIGHSMGGKAAMGFTLRNPEKISKLVVVDIALHSYDASGSFSHEITTHQSIIESLGKIDLMQKRSRSDVEQELASYISQKTIRDFLLKNLKRSKSGEFYWSLNINSLKNNIVRIMEGIDTEGKLFSEPVMLIAGKNSVYVNKEDYDPFRQVFPKLRIEELDAGHWVHAEQPEKTIDLLKDFLL